MKFTVHSLVKNEDQFVWYSINSVIDLAEKIIVFDTGSNDKTVEVIKTIKSPKILFEEKGSQTTDGLVKLRQQMIDQTKTDWFLVLDGDEIWPREQLKLLINEADKNPDIIAFVNRTRDCIGDIYHFLPEEAGAYQIAGKVGNLTIRLIKKTKDLIIEGNYPLEQFTNSSGPIQKQDEKLKFLDCWYLHATFLKRSSYNRSNTLGNIGRNKLPEKGLKFKEKNIPEVFTNPVPGIVDKPTRRSYLYEIASTFTTPLIHLKRILK